jgi:RNA polymerase sigma-70 factor (ECF subfamily)
VTPGSRLERFRGLYDATRPLVLGYALRRTSSAEDAADVMADTYTIAWAHLDDVPDDETSVLWLYATARGVIANRGRRERTRSRLLERVGAELRAATRASPEVSHEDAVVARVALDSLSEADREILMLTTWEGLGPAQLACVLNCSPVAARIRLHRGRARLRATMSEAGFVESPPDDTAHPSRREGDKSARNAAVAKP